METPCWCPSERHQYGGRKVKVDRQLLLSFAIKSTSYHSRDRIHFRGAFFWNYSGIGILGVDGICVLLGAIPFSE